jgi:hypothetical protein
MSLVRHAALVLGTVGVTLSALALGLPLSGPQRSAIVYGAVVAALNAIAAHALVRFADGRSTRVFLGAVLGGMAGRVALMLAAVAAGVLVLELPRLPLVFSLLGHFLAFLVLELALQQRAPRSAEAAR